MIRTPDLSIHYRQAGDGDQAIIFLHGNYASSRWWLPQLKRIPECIHAYAPDLRGCGGRDGKTEFHRSLDGLSVNDLVSDLDQFIDALRIKRPILVGHSFGGVIATDYALSHPDDVRGLVLVATAPPDGIPLAAFAESYAFWIKFATRTWMRHAFRRAGLSDSEGLLEDLIDDSLSSEPGQYSAFTMSLAHWNVESSLTQLKLPTLLVWGRGDLVVPARVGRRYLEVLPNAKMVVIPGAGHSPMIERADKFASILKAFALPLVPERRISAIRRLMPARRFGLRGRRATLG